MAKKLSGKGIAERLNKLNALTEETNKGIEKTDFIPIDSIIFNENNIFNNYDSDDSIAELAENIKANGLIHNIVVSEIEPHKYLLISGERRTRAMQYLGEDRIMATIKKNLSDLETLKLLFFANSETREYSTEEKVQIIEGFMNRIKKFEDGTEKESAAKFKEYVAQAFHINERQAYRLISITTDLIEPLKDLLFNDIITVEIAAGLAQLPAGYQESAANIIKANSSDNESDRKYSIEQALNFAKRAKSIISKTNTALVKQKTSRIYKQSRLEQAQKEILKIQDSNDTDLIEQKNKLEKDIAKYGLDIQQLDKEIELETQKQDNEVSKIYNNTISCVVNGLDASHKDNTGEMEQAKLIEKQIHKIELDLKKLKTMRPTKELNEMQSLLEQYKKQLKL